MAAEALSLPKIRVRGRSFMALVLEPEFPFGDWFAALDAQLRGSVGFFEGRPVVADLAAVTKAVGPDAVTIVLEGMAARGLKVVGVEGVHSRLLAGTQWERLATNLHGRDVVREGPLPATHAPARLIDRPVRSGQSLVFEDGDVTVVGSVASGAEVIAGGSIHIYGALRGRAIAGLKSGAACIFCRRMEAELVAVDQLYRTAEHWGAGLHGRAVQVLCDRGALRISALD